MRRDPRWRTSRAGNAYLNVGGVNIVVFARQEGRTVGVRWTYRLKTRAGATWFAPVSYATEAEAKAAALGRLQWLAQDAARMAAQLAGAPCAEKPKSTP